MHKKRLLIRFLRFCLTGIINTLLHVLIFAYLLQLSVHYLICQSIAFFIVNMITFAINKYWTFENQDPKISRQLLLSYLGRFITLAITLIFTYLLVEYLSVTPLLSQIYIVFINVILNFIISEIFIFKPVPKEKEYYLDISRTKFENIAPSSKITIFFVVPVYKEQNRLYPKSQENPKGEDFLRVKVNQIKELMMWNKEFSWRLIFIDDNDTKYHSGQLIKDYTLKVFPELMENGSVQVWFLHELAPDIAVNSQKGGAVITALNNLDSIGCAENDIAIYTDADISSDLRFTGILIYPLFKGYDISISSRWHKESTVVNRGVKENISSWLYNVIIYLFLQLDFSDTQNGFKAFKMASLKQILPFAKEYNFAFDTELLMLSVLFKQNISEEPIFWEDSSSETNVDLLRDPIRMVNSLRKQSVRKSKILKEIKKKFSEEKTLTII
ncbi:MAG: GtrA family protein [Bacteroidota bacterium]